jgi:protein-S-isoprenylcysteine O-methyltransferase Ste14
MISMYESISTRSNSILIHLILKTVVKMKRDKMSMAGVGVKFTIISIIYLFILTTINSYTESLFLIKQLSQPAAITISIILLLIGIPFYLLCAKTIRKAYNEGKLCTTGVYSTCRHPLYSSFIFFNVPGIVILFKSWLLLTTPLFMYLLLLILARKEEVYLSKKFGREYQDYKKNTNFAFPQLWKMLKI